MTTILTIREHIRHGQFDHSADRLTDDDTDAAIADAVQRLLAASPYNGDATEQQQDAIVNDLIESGTAALGWADYTLIDDE
ncbi:hypothetical protein [Gordonia malaquae]|uniref:hypothetical protein n=1 Tax=Gordonia malaquae TaxID=410332 RepID=UPI00301A2682